MITKLHEKAEIRTVEDIETGELFYSLIDVIYVFRDCFSRDVARSYWSVMKTRLRRDKRTRKLVECFSFKAQAKDGKYRATDFADFDHIVALVEYMSYSKIRLTDGSVSKVNISSSKHNETVECVKEMLDEYTHMPRTKFYFEDGCDNPNNFVYPQDRYRQTTGYVDYREVLFGSKSNEFLNSIINGNLKNGAEEECLDGSDKETLDIPCGSPEEFLEYLRTYYPICKN